MVKINFFLKIAQRVAFNTVSEASYTYKSYFKMQKKDPFCAVFENLKLAAKQVTFYPLVEITTTLPLSHKALLHTY